MREIEQKQAELAKLDEATAVLEEKYGLDEQGLAEGDRSMEGDGRFTRVEGRSA